MHVDVPQCGLQCCCVRRYPTGRFTRDDVLDSALALNGSVVAATLPALELEHQCQAAAPLLDNQFRPSQVHFIQINFFLLATTSAASEFVGAGAASDNQLLFRAAILCGAYCCCAVAVVYQTPYRPERIWLQPVHVFSLVLSAVASLYISLGSLRSYPSLILIARTLAWVVAILVICAIPFIVIAFLATLAVGADAETQAVSLTKAAAARAKDIQWRQLAATVAKVQKRAASLRASGRAGTISDRDDPFTPKPASGHDVLMDNPMQRIASLKQAKLRETFSCRQTGVQHKSVSIHSPTTSTSRNVATAALYVRHMPGQRHRQAASRIPV